MSTIFTPLFGPSGETYQLRELTVNIGGSADATFSGTELFGTAKPLGASGRTAYVYLANPVNTRFIFTKQAVLLQRIKEAKACFSPFILCSRVESKCLYIKPGCWDDAAYALSVQVVCSCF